MSSGTYTLTQLSFVTQENRKKRLLLTGFILILLSIVLLSIVSVRSRTSYDALMVASKLKNKPQIDTVVPANSGGSAQNIKSANNKQTLSTSTASVPACTPVVATTRPRPVAPSATGNGVFQTSTEKNFYKVNGLTTTQISNQIHNCSPLISEGNHYAASSDYAINWSFSYTGNEQGLCTITSVAVGLSITEIYPSWTNSNNDAKLQSKWNNFITNLILHEDGHAKIDRMYADKIHSDLIQLQPTSCSSIVDTAHSLANARVRELNQANIQYDAQTNHGHTQGAIL